MAVRAIRGAIQVDADTRDDILTGAAELVRGVIERNQLDHEDFISIVFTATPDLTADFPAYAARLMGLTDVPLLCATEISVPGAMPGCCGCWPTSRPTSRDRPCTTSTCAAPPACAPTCRSNRPSHSTARRVRTRRRSKNSTCRAAM